MEAFARGDVNKPVAGPWIAEEYGDLKLMSDRINKEKDGMKCELEDKNDEEDNQINYLNTVGVMIVEM